MLVAITSDIHNNLANLKKVLDYCADKKIHPVKSRKTGAASPQFNGVNIMICCGDLASLETLDFLNDNFSGKIFYCFGNMDDEQMTSLQRGHPERSEACLPARQGSRINNASVLSNKILHCVQNDAEKYKNTLVFKNHGEIKIAGKSVAFVHYPNMAKKLAESGKYDFVFYGHTHKPWEEMIGQCKVLNPGNVANEVYPPTFAIWNTENDKFELVRVNELE